MTNQQTEPATSMLNKLLISEKLAKTSLSLPVHEFIGKREINHMASKIDKFYKDR